MPLTGGNRTYMPADMGRLIDLRPTPPAAGFNLLYTYPGPQAILLKSIYFGLNADANVANRYANVTIIDNFNNRPLWYSQKSLATTAGTSNAHPWNTKNMNVCNLHWSTVHSGPFPEAWLLPNWDIWITVNGLQVGDTIYSIAIYGLTFQL